MRESMNGKTVLTTTRVILARHGETRLNVEERFRGRSDPPLSERGVRQAAALAAALAELQPTRVVASPRQRAIETARAIAERAGIEPSVEERLDDLDYGEWTGLTHEEVRARWPLEYELWQRSPERVRFPGGERLISLRRRADALLSEMYAARKPGIVLVTHDVVIRVLVCQLLGARLASMHRLHVGLASTSGLSRGDQGDMLEWFSESPPGVDGRP